ncbi:MarR family winged helix-turn-helix transcriptional regulator [Caproicibacter sp. BJN0012]|uniref:MarR family winged helix-turn-helix transcriptional regulator n=1 Tax=Caproicibacter sp. BJN0012 TaxID=3110227 RepID=UPI002E12A142|nr:MarR family transcriptional regulator [Caproicibacter sp. BJN0012]
MTAREIFFLNLVDQLNRQPSGSLPGVRISELGSAAGMSKPAISQLVRVLEKKGLIRRSTDRKDRRVILVCLSQSGARQLEQSTRSCQSMINQITEKLGPEDTAELRRLFNRIRLILCEKDGDACHKE